MDCRNSIAVSERSDEQSQYPPYPNTNGSTTTTTTTTSRPSIRTTSYTPSYMSIPNVQQHSRNDSVQTSQSRNASTASNADGISASGPSGVVLVMVASSLHPSILRYLETILSRQTFAGIVLAARQEQEAELKQLKMDTYALIGKLRRELSVETRLQESWSQAEMAALLDEGARLGTGIRGVLCCPGFAPKEVVDVLDVSEHELQKSWQESVSFVHSASKTIIPQLLTTAKSAKHTANGKSTKEPRGPFFLVATSDTQACTSSITKAAVDALIQQLSAATRSAGLTVGHAETTLVPDPIKKDDLKPVLEPVITDVAYDSHVQDCTFAPGESPTKLWNMWALQEQLDRAD